MSLIYSFCNVDLEKCRELVYDTNIRNLPKAVRWGAILKEDDLEIISYILGDDMLSPEEKEEFLNTMKEVSNNENILDDWLLDALARDKLECQIDYAKEQGTRHGEENSKIEIIKNMLFKHYDYESISEITGKTIDEIMKI